MTLPIHTLTPFLASACQQVSYMRNCSNAMHVHNWCHCRLMCIQEYCPHLCLLRLLRCAARVPFVEIWLVPVGIVGDPLHTFPACFTGKLRLHQMRELIKCRCTWIYKTIAIPFAERSRSDSPKWRLSSSIAELSISSCLRFKKPCG